MRRLCFLLLCISLLSCNQGQKKKKNVQEEMADQTESSGKKANPVDTISLEKYSNNKYSFSLKFPKSLAVLESRLPGDVPVINIYEPDSGKNPPFSVHEQASLAYLAFLPEGYGVDAPSGDQVSLQEWEGSVPLEENFEKKESKIYRLKNGKAWAMSLRLKEQPKSWSPSGMIYVHFKVKNFQGECLDGKTGKTKPLNECEEMGGNDRLIYSGEVDDQCREELLDVLKTLKTGQNFSEEKTASDYLQIENPLPNIEIASPLKIKGKAKGAWFFEAQAPVELVDKDGKVLAQASIKTKGNWMTDDFVPFSGELQFENAPDDERGYLIFNRANPSGKPENEMEYRLPVLFPPK